MRFTSFILASVLGIATIATPLSAETPYARPVDKPSGKPWCGDFQNGVNWPVSGFYKVSPRGYSNNDYQPDSKTAGALFAGPYQWGGARCGGWCERDGSAAPICTFYQQRIDPYPTPTSKPDGEPWCGDFENGVNWPATGETSLTPRGYPANAYQPDGKTSGALFAGPYQWGGVRCGGWCDNPDGTEPNCKLKP